MVLAGLRGVCRPQADGPSLRVVAFGALVSEEGEVPFLKENVGSRSLELKPLLRVVINVFGFARIKILSQTGTDFVRLWKA